MQAVIQQDGHFKVNDLCNYCSLVSKLKKYCLLRQKSELTYWQSLSNS